MKFPEHAFRLQSCVPKDSENKHPRLTIVVLSMKDKELLQTVNLEVQSIPSFTDTI
jgi:hypothetical protein